MVDLFGLILIWGIPALFLWSIILSIIHVVKDQEANHFLERIVMFIAGIYTYGIHSLAAWFGLICILFGIAGFTEGGFFASILFLAFGIYMVYNFFPRINMPD